MFRSIDRSPRRRNRAVTLIEAVLYISIALALIVGGLVFYQQASTAAKTSTMVRQLSALAAETKVLMRGIPLTDIPMNLEPFLISAGAVPSDMVKSATELSTPFGAIEEIWAYAYDNGGSVDHVFGMTLMNIPQGVCARLLTASAGSTPAAGATTLVSTGLISVSVTRPGGGYEREYVMNATQAGWMCKYGSPSYTNQTTEPTSTPLRGNVTVAMQFIAHF